MTGKKTYRKTAQIKLEQPLGDGKAREEAICRMEKKKAV